LYQGVWILNLRTTDHMTHFFKLLNLYVKMIRKLTH